MFNIVANKITYSWIIIEQEISGIDNLKIVLEDATGL